MRPCATDNQITDPGQTPAPRRFRPGRPSPPDDRDSDPRRFSLVCALLAWFRQNARDLPWRRTRDPYAIWVSEIMLQQTQVKTVVPYWERWMRALPTLAALARARPEQVLKLWEGLGYYSRARHLHAAARWLVRKHAGRFPRTFAAVLALPGVGRYTAGAICSIAFNQPTPILDGNLMRVFTRLFCIRQDPRQSRTQTRLWQIATQWVRQAADLAHHPRNPMPQRPLTPLRWRAADTCSHLNQALMELGAVICTPRHPRCPECPVQAWCQARQRGCAAALPNTGRRPAPVAQHRIAFVIERRGRFLICQRPAHGLNGGLWEFPNVEGNGVAEPGDGNASHPRVLVPRPRPRLRTGREIEDERRRRTSPQLLRAPAQPTGKTDGVPRAALKKLAADGWRLNVASLRPLCDVRHAITRHRIHLRAYRATACAGPLPRRADQRWLSPAGLQALPFASAHGKIRAALLDALGY